MASRSRTPRQSRNRHPKRRLPGQRSCLATNREAPYRPYDSIGQVAAPKKILRQSPLSRNRPKKQPRRGFGYNQEASRFPEMTAPRRIFGKYLPHRQTRQTLSRRRPFVHSQCMPLDAQVVIIILDATGQKSSHGHGSILAEPCRESQYGIASLAIAAGVRLVPAPGGLDDRLDRGVLRFPAQPLDDPLA
jgi:hypothetical protein